MMGKICRDNFIWGIRHLSSNSTVPSDRDEAFNINNIYTTVTISVDIWDLKKFSSCLNLDKYIYHLMSNPHVCFDMGNLYRQVSASLKQGKYSWNIWGNSIKISGGISWDIRGNSFEYWGGIRLRYQGEFSSDIRGNSIELSGGIQLRYQG